MEYINPYGRKIPYTQLDIMEIDFVKFQVICVKTTEKI